MYEISSKTGMHHRIASDMPTNQQALQMWRGHNLPDTVCGKQIIPVNFYESGTETRPQFQCSRCFEVTP